MAGGATTHRTFVSYIDRTREFYAVQGYDKPYRWAWHGDAPFAPLPKPLSECTLTVVTSASPWHERAPVDGVLRGQKQVWSGRSDEIPVRLYTADLAWDKEATHTDDVESFLPIRQLQARVQERRIGAVAPHFHGVPTDYSQRRTVELDAPEILRRCREDGVDVALLVPL
jgi:hypothetical protein